MMKNRKAYKETGIETFWMFHPYTLLQIVRALVKEIHKNNFNLTIAFTFLPYLVLQKNESSLLPWNFSNT